MRPAQVPPIPKTEAGVSAATGLAHVPPPAPGYHDAKAFPELNAQRIPADLCDVAAAQGVGMGGGADAGPSAEAGVSAASVADGGAASSAVAASVADGGAASSAARAAAREDETGDWDQSLSSVPAAVAGLVAPPQQWDHDYKWGELERWWGGWRSGGGWTGGKARSSGSEKGAAAAAFLRGLRVRAARGGVRRAPSLMQLAQQRPHQLRTH